MEGSEILETKTKGVKRLYKFSEIHQTTSVKFYNYNLIDENKTLLVEVPIEEIAKNAYSLNHTEYMNDEPENYNSTIKIKTLGDICKFLPKSKRHASYGVKQGKYPFYTSSQICSKYCDEYDYEDECLIIGTGGNANIKYDHNFSCSADNFIIKIISEDLIKYIYYYLSINIEILQKGFIGVGIQHISKEYLCNIKIPIPSLEKQKEIVDYIDNNNEIIKNLEKEIENNKKQTEQFMKSIVK
jgi:restriction endonuclease S subunit